MARTRNRSMSPGRKPESDRAPTEAAPAAAPPLEIAPEEVHRLAECAAFFKAEHYREAEPGAIRRQDVESVEADIEAVVEKIQKP